jgi:hypothetical protein
MTRELLAAACAALLCTLTGAVTAAAQPSAAPTRAGETLALGLELNAAPADLDANALRAAISRELDLQVELGEWGATRAALGVIAVTIERNAARVVYRRTGTAVERIVALPAAPSERIQLIAFLATNLVRDQTSEVLAKMSRAPASPVRAEPAPAAPPSNEMIASAGVFPPVQIDRLYGEHHVVGAGLYLIAGMQDGTKFVSLSGAVDYQRQFASGAQIAGAVAINRRVDGLQLAGATSIANDVGGVQIAGGAAIASSIAGVQLAGGLSYASEVHGVQLAAVNVAGRLHGVQLGFLNISDGEDDAVPIGFINIARHGRTELEASVDSSLMSTLELRHGPRHIQNVWGVSWIEGYDRPLAGLGLGFHVDMPGSPVPFSVDLDAVAWTPIRFNDASDFRMIDQLRATVAVPVGPIDVVGGAVGNVYIADGGTLPKDLLPHPQLEHTYVSGTTRVTLWPSAFLGVRLRH